MSPAVLGSQRRLRETHAMSSLRVSRLREKLRPHVSLFGSNDNDLNGISYSAVQPPSNSLRAGEPDAVPVAVVLGDVAIQAVEAHAVRVQAEEVAAAARVERVERHEQRVFLRDRGALPHDVRRELAGRREHPRARCTTRRRRTAR